MSKSGIIKTLTTSGIGKTIIRKPEKIYFSNSNIIYALSQNVEIGNVRETFFLSQLSTRYKVSYPKQGDFQIENNLLFEIGGKNKTNKQIAGIKDSFLALDGIEFGYKNRIPLWMFGFLY